MKIPRSNKPFESIPTDDPACLYQPGNFVHRLRLGGSDYPPGTVRFVSVISSGVDRIIGKHLSTVIPWHLTMKTVLKAVQDNPALAAEMIQALTLKTNS